MSMGKMRLFGLLYVAFPLKCAFILTAWTDSTDVGIIGGTCCVYAATVV